MVSPRNSVSTPGSSARVANRLWRRQAPAQLDRGPSPASLGRCTLISERLLYEREPTLIWLLLIGPDGAARAKSPSVKRQHRPTP